MPHHVLLPHTERDRHMSPASSGGCRVTCKKSCLMQRKYLNITGRNELNVDVCEIRNENVCAANIIKPNQLFLLGNPMT